MGEALRIGVIGTGAIARSLVAHLAGASPTTVVCAALGKSGHLEGVARATSLEALLRHHPDAVVEAATQSAATDLAPRVLRAGIDVILLSVGALADAEARAMLLRAAEEGGSRILIPSGAVGGLDALSAAASTGSLESVEVEQRKPPRTLLPQHEADALEVQTVLFDGPAAEAVVLFPRTTNISACVSLAGIGFERTRVRVIADPEVRGNAVTVRALGSFGTFVFSLNNVPSENPRTSAIVAQSVVATLARLRSPYVIPA